MGSQAYGIGAGLQSLGNSMMQAMTMYSLLNEDPKEPEAQLTEKQKIAKKAELARAQGTVDDSTMNDDESIASAYSDLNLEFGEEEELRGGFDNFRNFGADTSGGSITGMKAFDYNPDEDELNPYELLGRRF